MFIKEGYQRRIAEQVITDKITQTQKQILLKKVKPKRQPKIGSIRNDKINYDRDQQFFNHDDVTSKGRTGKLFKQDFTDPDILDLKKKPWNISVQIPKSIQDQQSLSRKLLKIRIGMNDFGQLPCRPNKIYQGTQVRDDFKNWNVSTFVTNKQLKKGLEKKNVNAYHNSDLYSSKKLLNYLKPIQRYQKSQNLRKNDIQQNISLSQTLKSNYLFNHPKASVQKANAQVFKLLEEQKRQILKDLLLSNSNTLTSLNSNVKFKAKLTTTQKSKIKIIYKHTGIWHKVRFQNWSKDQSKNNTNNENQNQQYAWSCCMNSVKQSKGCSKKILDGNKTNFSSSNNA